MPDKGNLKPVRSKEEARAKGKKGGIASGESRKKKRPSESVQNCFWSLRLRTKKQKAY